jgi:hypothetical protein
MRTYTVKRESNGTETRVRAGSPADAALAGAIKLGIRYQPVKGGRRKPTLVMAIAGQWRFATYCYDESLNASNNIHQPVNVES